MADLQYRSSQNQKYRLKKEKLQPDLIYFLKHDLL